MGRREYLAKKKNCFAFFLYQALLLQSYPRAHTHAHAHTHAQWMLAHSCCSVARGKISWNIWPAGSKACTRLEFLWWSDKCSRMTGEMYCLISLFLQMKFRYCLLECNNLKRRFYVGKNSQSLNSPSLSPLDLAMQLNQGKFEYNGSCG